MSLQKPELFQLLKVAQKAASIADQILLEHFGRLSTLEEKNRAGLVTNVDRESEAELTKFFRTETPDFRVVGEEAAYFDSSLVETEKTAPRWVIDPLDGTTNYVHMFPVFCVSIGLEINERAVLGVISVPKLNQVFSAAEGCGATCNDQPISVSDRGSLKDSLVATGFTVSKPDRLESQLKCFDSVIAKTRGIRRAGSAAYDLAMVASGVFDAYWESDLQPWDTSAGSVLVREAGGSVTQYDGSQYVSSDSSILATNGKVHNEIHQALVAHGG